MKNATPLIVLISSVYFSLFTTSAFGVVVYVDRHAPAGGDGTTWITAYQSLEPALQAVEGSADPQSEIRIAQGTYIPTGGQTDPNEPASVTFHIPDAVTIRGGYAGAGSPTPDERDPAAYPTILSGDLLGNDGPGFSNYDDNANVVVITDNLTTGSTIDGVSIAHGRAGGRHEAGQLTLSNCRVGPNRYGAIVNRNGQLTMTGSSVVGNGDWDQYHYRAGVLNEDGGRVVIDRCFFARNVGSSGIALSNQPTATAICTNSVFVKNFGYGAAILNTGAMTMTNCAVVGNVRRRIVPGLDYVAGVESTTDLSMSNCILWDNRNDVGVSESTQLNVYNVTSATHLNNNCIQGWSGSFGGVGNFGAEPRFVDPDGVDNELGTADDDFRLRGDSPCIDAGTNYVDIDPGLPGVQPIPLLDYLGMSRFVDDPNVPDVGSGSAPIVDIGPTEAALPDILVSSNLIEVAESAQATIYVWLSGAPQSTVTVTIGIDPPGPFSIVSGATLTFDASNYSFPQSVSIRSEIDPGYIDDRSNMSISAPGYQPQELLLIQSDGDDSQDTLFVKEDAAGNGTGASWDNAFTTLQAALDAASLQSTIREIWVAEGTYYPSRERFQSSARSKTFLLRSGLSVYGGFEGDESTVDDRNPSAHPTTLSGDLDRNDGGSPGDVQRSDNAFNVVTIFNNDEVVVLDGFVIVGGSADRTDPQPSNDAGAGVVVEQGKALIIGCRFIGNHATIGGGLALVDGGPFGDVEIRDSEFRDNHSGSGGAVCDLEGAMRIRDCIFAQNTTTGDYAKGGAICFVQGDMEISGSQFVENAATADTEYPLTSGGAIQAYHSMHIDNCEFTGNDANYGGAVSLSGGGDLRITNSQFTDNSATDDGAAIDLSHVHGGLIQNCRFERHQLPGDFGTTGAVLSGSWAAPSVINCQFVDNINDRMTTSLVPIQFFPDDQDRGEMAGCLFSNNAGGDYGVGLLRQYDISDCVFVGNSGHNSGGLQLTDSTLTNCRFLGNHSTSSSESSNSAAVTLNDYSSMQDCFIAGNTASRGGSVVCDGDEIEIRNCTVTRNSVGEGPDGILTFDHPLVTNSILANAGEEFEGSPVFLHSCVNSEASVMGEGNITSDPAFVDVDGPDNNIGTQDDDPSILATSPCANAGSNAEAALSPVDVLGNPRIVGCRVDMGAAESSAVTFNDCNGNNIDDACDVLEGGEPDCNQNSIPDACEIAADPSEDLNQNNVLDSCELRILRVDGGAAAGGSGDSWADAINDLQEALRIADAHSGPVQIWVAAGIHVPGVGADGPSSFTIPGNVALFGGFAGDETQLDQRDFDQNVTVLSGDNEGNDDVHDPCCDHDLSTECIDAVCRQQVCSYRPSCCTDVWDSYCDRLADSFYPGCAICDTVSDNSKVVVVIAGSNNTAVIDGFTIRDARSSDFLRAGGVRVTGGSPVVQNCWITENNGYGIWANDAALTLNQCRVDSTDLVGSKSGGVALYVANGDLIQVSDCVFEDNITGVRVQNAVDFEIRDCLIDQSYGGVFADGCSKFRCINSVITLIGLEGESIGAMSLSNSSDSAIESCTIAQNPAVGVFGEGTLTLSIVNSIVWGNRGYGLTLEQRQIRANTNSGNNVTFAVRNCCVEGLDRFTGNQNIGADPRFVDVVSGDLRLQPSSPCGDAGDESLNSIDLTFDVAGAPRTKGCGIDIGAYEIQTGAMNSADFDGDGSVTMADLESLVELLLQPSPLGDCVGDLNDDGTLDGGDVGLFIDRLVP